jgi:hypothetical protein
MERLLDTRGRTIGPVRIAAGRSGVVLGFPRDPMIHLSWLALIVAGGLIIATRRRRA